MEHALDKVVLLKLAGKGGEDWERLGETGVDLDAVHRVEVRPERRHVLEVLVVGKDEVAGLVANGTDAGDGARVEAVGVHDIVVLHLVRVDAASDHLQGPASGIHTTRHVNAPVVLGHWGAHVERLALRGDVVVIGVFTGPLHTEIVALLVAVRATAKQFVACVKCKGGDSCPRAGREAVKGLCTDRHRGREECVAKALSESEQIVKEAAVASNLIVATAGVICVRAAADESVLDAGQKLRFVSLASG